MKQWYEQLFENYANSYEKEPFVAGTRAEVDFIEKETGYDKGLSILDIGCGTGRHAIELAGRGYQVTGIDLSPAQIEKARSNAELAAVKVNFIVADARSLDFDQEFDLVTMICEGGFALMETDDMNYAILRSARKALKPKGIFIFTTLNGLFPLFHSVKDFLNKEYEENPISECNFDLMTFRDHSSFEFEDDDGIKNTIQCDERYYVPSEITWLLRSLSFSTTEIFGAEIGRWDRQTQLSTEHYEMLVIAKL